MKRSYLKISMLLGASLLLTNCGKKNFSSQTSEASVNSLREPSVPVEPTDPTPSTDPDPTKPDLLAQDACVSTVQWYDGFNWIPYTNDDDCIRKMKLLITSQTQDMMNYEIRHLTKAQLKTYSDKAKDTNHFVSLFLAQTRPIYAFTGGWINN